MKNTNVKRSVYVNTILKSVFFNDSIGIFMRYPCLKIMSVFHITLMPSKLRFLYKIIVTDDYQLVVIFMCLFLVFYFLFKHTI